MISLHHFFKRSMFSMLARIVHRDPKSRESSGLLLSVNCKVQSSIIHKSYEINHIFLESHISVTFEANKAFYVLLMCT